MLTVHLSNLKFFARHGVYEGEAAAGNEFEVHIEVSYDEAAKTFDRLGNVLNYEELFTLVRRRMAIATPLLEQLADGIIREIRQEYSFVKEIRVSVFKLQPPIGSFQGKVGITLQKKFDAQ